LGSGWIESDNYVTALCSISRSIAGSTDVTVVKIEVGELVSGGRVRSRAPFSRRSADPCSFELLEAAHGSIFAWLEHRSGTLDDFAFPSRMDHTDTSTQDNMVDSLMSG
jgi:hypothetical protein